MYPTIDHKLNFLKRSCIELKNNTKIQADMLSVVVVLRSSLIRSKWQSKNRKKND